MKPGAAAVVSVFAIGCGGGGAGTPSLPPVQWESAHFRYAAWPDDSRACADITTVLEEHWAFWHSQLGLPDPGSSKILYAKHRGFYDLLDDGWCPDTAAGCTTGTEVRAYLLFDRHELIHAYLGETMAPPAPLFAEGAAVAFSCDAGGSTSAAGRSWRDLLDPPADSPDWISLYPGGGQLVSYLFTRFGAAALIDFYRRIVPLTDADAIAGEFEAVFGSTLDDIWTLATASSSPVCLPLWECTREAIPLDGAPQTGQLLCGQNLVPRTLRISAEVNLAASVRNAPSSLYLSSVCGDSSAVGTISLWPGGDFQLLADLVPGTYLVNMGDAEITAQALDQPSVGNASSCDQLVPFSVAATGPPLFVAASARDVAARVRFADPRSGVLAGHRASHPTTTIQSCPDCAADTTGCPVANDLDLQATFQGDYVWRMQAFTSGWATAYFHDPP
jgi:hypothetical protein